MMERTKTRAKEEKRDSNKVGVISREIQKVVEK